MKPFKFSAPKSPVLTLSPELRDFSSAKNWLADFLIRKGHIFIEVKCAESPFGIFKYHIPEEGIAELTLRRFLGRGQICGS